MIIQIVWKQLKNLLRVEEKKRPKITLLVPFRADNPHRERVFKWLKKYWDAELPDAELIVGFSRSDIFCKTEAFNNALRRAKGKVIVLLDADAYLPGKILEDCADEILNNLDNHLWFVPYKHLFRLTEESTAKVLDSDPADPYRFPSPPNREDVETWDKTMYGHRYGAMVMIMPREALEVLGCFDERFKGWGGEDVAILRALDTLYGRHKIKKNDLLHLYHPKIGATYQERRWHGQDKQLNNKLSMMYHRATNKPVLMRRLVDEGCYYRETHSNGVVFIISDLFKMFQDKISRRRVR